MVEFRPVDFNEGRFCHYCAARGVLRVEVTVLTEGYGFKLFLGADCIAQWAQAGSRVHVDDRATHDFSVMASEVNARIRRLALALMGEAGELR